MSASSDAAEQVVRFYLEGVEVACKVSGKGAEHVIALLLNVLKNQEQTRGKARLNKMLKTCNNLKVFTIQKKDLKKFAKEAKSYGVLYSALIDKQNKNLDGMVDIMVRDEDASKINRIVERFKLTTSNPVQVKAEVQKELKQELKKLREENKKDKSESDRDERSIGVKTKSQEDLEKEEVANFNMALTEKSPLSEPYSMTSKETKETLSKRKSVRAELSKIKQEMKKEKDFKAKEKSKNKGFQKKQYKKKSKSKEL